MMKVYTNQEVSKNLYTGPKGSVIKNLLNFSKSYEVLKGEEESKQVKPIGVILN